MKTKEELTALKEEYDAMSKKLRELDPDELKEVVGGMANPVSGLSGEIDPFGVRIGSTLKVPIPGLSGTIKRR